MIKTFLTVKNIAIAVLILFLAGSAIYGWYFKAPETRTLVWQEPTKIREVVKIKTVKVPGPKEVVTIEKEKVVEKLKLPEWLKADKNKQVIATAEVPPYKGTTNAAAVLDTETGESSIIIKPRPLPFLAFENDKEIGVRYGMDTKKGTVGALYGRWTFFRVGSVHTAVYGEIDNTATGRAMFDVGYRW